jgi:hypothetical protein
VAVAVHDQQPGIAELVGPGGGVPEREEWVGGVADHLDGAGGAASDARPKIAAHDRRVSADSRRVHGGGYGQDHNQLAPR